MVLHRLQQIEVAVGGGATALHALWLLALGLGLGHLGLLHLLAVDQERLLYLLELGMQSL